MKLHEDAHVEINDYGNDLSDIETFAKHLDIEISVIDAEQFNNIIYTANKCSEDKIYLLKTKNHFDVIKSLTTFYDTPYYCHECNKAYTKRDKHKCPSKCLSCFTYAKDRKCEGNEIVCEKCNRKFVGKRCFKNHLKNRSKVEDKTDIVCDTVKKCLVCNRIITGKYVNSHKCGYSECNNCNKYVGKNHKCYLKKVKAKGGNCMTGKKEPCKNNDSIKKTDWCYPCRTYTEKYIFIYIYENEFLDNMIRSGHRRLARSFNLCYRYIDDLIVFNNKKFLDYLKEIYPSQLTVEKANKSDHLADYLDLTFIIDSGGKLSTRLYDKRDDFDFHIVNFPFLSSNIPSGPSYGVYISQLIRYARCCSHYDDFRYRHKCLVDRLLSQGYKALRLEKSFKKFCGRYQDLIEKYRRSVNAMVSDSFPGQFLFNM